jgi:hypothetical protein
VFKDRETGSRWQQSSLEATSGPLQGTHLALYPFLLTNWREWRRLHADTLVLKPLPGYADRIPEKNRQIRAGLKEEGAAPEGVLYKDDRLKPRAMVLGVNIDGATKAFPLEALRQARVINDRIGGKPIVIVHQPASDTTTAFVGRAGAQALTMSAANADASELVDRETGSRWTAYGECVAGRLKGSQLELVILEPEYWFAWSEFHRGTDLYTPPRP